LLTISWVKNTLNGWLPLEMVELAGVNTSGVYIIWHSGNPGRVVRVGQGDIADRIGEHKKDQQVLTYKLFGSLYVTWASVSVFQRDGVERYLADAWKPLIGDRFPNVTPIAVNSPWG
jgi:hypothetical protein